MDEMRPAFGLQARMFWGIVSPTVTYSSSSTKVSSEAISALFLNADPVPGLARYSTVQPAGVSRGIRPIDHGEVRKMTSHEITLRYDDSLLRRRSFGIGGARSALGTFSY